jgi:hypothetical protein
MSNATLRNANLNLSKLTVRKYRHIFDRQIWNLSKTPSTIVVGPINFSDDDFVSAKNQNLHRLAADTLDDNDEIARRSRRHDQKLLNEITSKLVGPPVLYDVTSGYVQTISKTTNWILVQTTQLNTHPKLIYMPIHQCDLKQISIE